MTLTELQKLSDQEFSWTAGRLLNLPKVHIWGYISKGDCVICECELCGAHENDGLEGCTDVPIELDWNTAMEIAIQCIEKDRFHVGMYVITYYYKNGNNITMDMNPRNVITAVLLARGLVEGE
jgi:hypothetical protein